MAQQPMRPRNQGGQSSNTSQNRNDPPADTTATDETKTEEAPTQQPEQTPAKDEVVSEAATPSPEQPSDTAVSEAPAESEDLGEDTQLVTDFKGQLSALAEALNQPGRTPEDYREAAQITAQVTRFVIRTPRHGVLSAYLTFLKDNADTVGSPRVFLKGVSTLSTADQQQVTYLHTLFYDLATGKGAKVNSSQVIQAVKKPEIIHFYNRQVAANNQSE